ncbi:MAG: ABC transporter permease [Candidatus Hodarchaeota archaeon]
MQTFKAGLLFRNTFTFIRNNKSLSVGGFILFMIVFSAVFADFITPYGYAERNDDCEGYITCKRAPPSSKHIFGTDLLGRDMFTRVIFGGRIALMMAFTATIFAVMLGVPLGIVSGYIGGRFDRFFTAFADIVYSFPALLLAIMLAIYFRAFGLFEDIGPVVVSTAVVYIPTYFRVVRSQVQQVKEQEYIDAAKSIGASKPTILMRYIVPNVLASSIAIIPFNMTDAILTNAALAFLGLGIVPPTPDWGYAVYEAKPLVIVTGYPWLMVFPALMIFLLAFSLSLIGDALNDKFNPIIQAYVLAEKGA